jgi:hypothetical protein
MAAAVFSAAAIFFTKKMVKKQADCLPITKLRLYQKRE